MDILEIFISGKYQRDMKKFPWVCFMTQETQKWHQNFPAGIEL